MPSDFQMGLAGSKLRQEIREGEDWGQSVCWPSSLPVMMFGLALSLDSEPQLQKVIFQFSKDGP